MTDTTDQNERYRLENELDRKTRQCEALKDIQRSAQYLVDAIHVHEIGTPEDHPFQDAYANLRSALRAYYQPNGTGR